MRIAAETRLSTVHVCHSVGLASRHRRPQHTEALASQLALVQDSLSMDAAVHFGVRPPVTERTALWLWLDPTGAGTPIMNMPQTAVLGMHATKPRAVVVVCAFTPAHTPDASACASRGT